MVLDQRCMIKRGYSLAFHIQTVHNIVLMMTINFKFVRKPTVGEKNHGDIL